MTDNNLPAQLVLLQKAFAASLPEKFSRLKALLAQCDTAFNAQLPLPEATRRDLHLVVHSLAGSSGTFGFAALGNAAHALEEKLATLFTGTAPMEATHRQQLAAGIAALETAAQTPPTQPGAGSNVLATAREAAAARHGTGIVYLVEDDIALAENLAAQLAHFGYRTRLYARPEDVVREAHCILPIAIIMDIGFPENPLAGPHAAGGEIREHFKGVPVLFLSGRGDFAARLEAVRAGGVAYFTKPVDIGALVNALDAYASQTVPRPYRVLVVDDSEATAAFYVYTLNAAGMEASALNDPARIAEPLADFAPDLILMDIYMPTCNGIELAALIRQQSAFVGIPIVFLSTETNTNRQLVALRQGGDDFLCKPIDPARLISVVNSRAARARILRAHMSTDGLTGLINHSHLKEQLATEMLRSRRHGTPLVFAMLDIDHFKRVNDTWGHAAGDRVLRSLARLLRERLRRTDVAGRYGGEEFGLILTDIDAAGAHTLLDNIRRDFSALRHASEASEFSVTFSAGIAEFPQHRDIDKLVGAADAALYAAKHAGRDRIVCDSPLETGSAQ